jgi:hypothetical protein
VTESEREIAPVRGDKHQALAVFVGQWSAEGESYGSPNQPPEDPKSTAAPWTSSHTGKWHTGEFFVIQDERAVVGAIPIAWPSTTPSSGSYVARRRGSHHRGRCLDSVRGDSTLGGGGSNRYVVRQEIANSRA